MLVGVSVPYEPLMGPHGIRWGREVGGARDGIICGAIRPVILEENCGVDGPAKL